MHHQCKYIGFKNASIIIDERWNDYVQRRNGDTAGAAFRVETGSRISTVGGAKLIWSPPILVVKHLSL